jgi:hypothetical protein
MAWYFLENQDEPFPQESDMPLSPDSPNSQDVPGPVVSQNLTKMHIHNFQVHVDPNGAADEKIQVHVQWSEGYEDGGIYYPVKQHAKMYSGAALEAALQENTTGGTFYGEVKAKLWSWMQAQGDAPAGTVT